MIINKHSVAFWRRPDRVYADGLMSHVPTRTALTEMVACRIERLHLDLVPGFAPLLLSERHVSVAGRRFPAVAGPQ